MNRLAIILLLTVGTSTFAQAADRAAEPPAYSHATLPAPDTMWPFPVLMLVAVMFITAAIIGPQARLEMHEEIPPVHSHDEPPGTSHHHGPGGTVQPGPEHDLPGGHHH